MALSYEETKEKALRLLEFRSYSESELHRRLIRAGADEESAERVIGFCREYRLVDDTSYAKRRAAELTKKYGKARVVSELRRRGIDRGIIDEAVEGLEFDEDELLRLVRRKLGGDFERKSIDRCMRYFLYRGFSAYEIREKIETVKGEADEI